MAGLPFPAQFLETVPGKAGIADFGCDISERNIIISCSVLPQRSFADLVSVLDNVAEWLNPENGLKQLVLDDLPDRYFMARLSEAVDCERLLRTAGSFELRLFVQTHMPMRWKMRYLSSLKTGLHELERVKGNADSNPVYLLKGLISTSSSSYISLITNGEELRIVGSLSEGETLVIDSGMVTAKVIDETGGTLRNGLPSLQDLNFPILRKGVNNIEIAAENATFTELKIQAKSRWR